MAGATYIVVYGVSYGLMLAIISIGLAVTMGLMRVMNMAHGAFAAAGGYLAAWLITSGHVHFALAIPAAAIAMAAFGVLLERTLIRSVYGAPELEQVLTTIGLNFIAVGAFTLLFGTDVVPLQLPATLKTSIDLGFRTVETYRLFLVAFGVVLIACMWWLFAKTGLGAVLRAAVDNPTMAQSIGIRVPLLFSITFALGTALAALGGGLGAQMFPLEPLYPFKHLVIILTVVALAGFGRIMAVVGVAIIIGIVDNGTRYLFPDVASFATYILLIGLIVWRKDGLFAGISAK